MYTCKEVIQLLDLYTDGELDEQHRLLVGTHLQSCDLCSRLVRLREEEARMIRSHDPVPALSPGFTRQVMASLSPDMHPSTRGQWLSSLRKSLAQPWLAPALAGLILLVAVSYAASLRLITTNQKQVAFQNSQSGLQAQTQLALPGNTTPETEHDQAFNENNSLNKQELAGSAASKPTVPKPPVDSIEADRAAGSRNIPAVSQTARPTTAINPKAVSAPDAQTPETGGTPEAKTPAVSTTDAKTPEVRMMSLAPRQNSLDALKQQGYTVLQPSYLPPGYIFEQYSLLSGGSDESQSTARFTGTEDILLSYRNAQSGALLTLEIQTPANPAPPSQTDANPNAQGSRQTGTNRITQSLQKLGRNFVLQITGTIPSADLQKVADSVQ